MKKSSEEIIKIIEEKLKEEENKSRELAIDEMFKRNFNICEKIELTNTNMKVTALREILKLIK